VPDLHLQPPRPSPAPLSKDEITTRLAVLRRVLEDSHLGIELDLLVNVCAVLGLSTDQTKTVMGTNTI